MSERADRLEQLAALLAAALPLRRVTRSYRGHAMRLAEDLQAGLLTLVSTVEGDYQNLNGRLGMDCRRRVLLIGQLQIDEADDPVLIEQAELDLFEDVLSAMATGTGLLRCLDLKDFRQSGQLDHPYGGFVLEMELLA